MNPKLSIIIVNFNAGAFLRKCIASIYAETTETSFEIWVVDNNSRDDSVAMVKRDFPAVHLIENAQNVGFARANNQAIAQCAGDYILLLNPDTVLLSAALDKMVRFMDENPRVGVAGCKVLNPDGSLQLACRRMIPTPSVAFFRMTGLSRLFPRSTVMARYNLTYLDENEVNEVDAVSGAFLMVRREVLATVGGLDDNFFLYGEELDFCLRVKRAGLTVMYYPNAQIIHYKGECSKSNGRKAAFEFHRAMYLFHKKHYAQTSPWFVNCIVYLGIIFKACSSWKSFLFPSKVGSKG